MNQVDAFHRLRTLVVGLALLGAAVATSLSVAAGGGSSAKNQQRLRVADQPKQSQESTDGSSRVR